MVGSLNLIKFPLSLPPSLPTCRTQNIKYKEKAQRLAAHERKLQKRRDRKARDLALFATWRGTADDSTVAGDAKQ